MLYSSNQIYKYGWTPMQFGEKRVIDNNALAEKRIEQLQEELEKEYASAPVEGFREGFTPEQIAAMVDAGFNDGMAESTSGNVMKSSEQAVEDAQEKIDEMMAQAQAEIEQMKEEVQRQIARERAQILEESREQGHNEGYNEGKELGYNEGHQEGVQEGQEEGRRSFDADREALEEEYQQKQKALMEEYEKKIEELEPKFVTNLTAIYEHIFEVDLKKNRDIIVHLISNTMRNIEGDSGYLIHVSKDDYPYVSVQKKELLQGCGMAIDDVEIIEDATLSRNECMIETGSGVFDCSLGTELESLRDELLLLAYKQKVPEG